MAVDPSIRARLAYDPGSQLESLLPIPWPDGLQPTPATVADGRTGPNDPLPQADVLILTYTVAEARALADVLTPGVQSTGWNAYARNWSEFEAHLPPDAPARAKQQMASYWPTKIGATKVLCAKSELHPATDGPTLPIANLWLQMIEDAKPALVITTGTAGGIGSNIVEGDVLVSATVHWDCTGTLKEQPYANQVFSGPAFSAGPHLGLAQSTLIPVNAGRLRPTASRDPIILTSGRVITCDSFLFDDAEDTYGLRAYDPAAQMEEMDDGALPVALSRTNSSLPWLSVRCASDPQAPKMATIEDEKHWAEAIYQRLGYWAAVGSVITCWAIVADRP
jgi:nucleoside phosphorylase